MFKVLLFHFQSQYLIRNDCSIGIVKALNFNIGFCNHFGIFEVILNQGLTLPCQATKVFTTVVNYQNCIELELYRGFRPLERYCEFLGTVAIEDISIDKANKIKIEVKFCINDNEELSVESFEQPSNKKLKIITKNFKMKWRYEHNFHDLNVNRENDQKLVDKLKLISNLINRIRAHYDGNSERDEMVSKKMDEMTNQVIKTNKIIEIDACDELINSITAWLKQNKLD